MGNNKKKISDILKSLSKDDREQLRMAHNNDIAQYIKLKDDRFIGVHLNGIRHLLIEDQHNDWYIGVINYPSNGVKHV